MPGYCFRKIVFSAGVGVNLNSSVLDDGKACPSLVSSFFFLGIHTRPGYEDFILSAHYVYSILFIGTLCSVGWIQRLGFELTHNSVKIIESRTM